MSPFHVIAGVALLFAGLLAYGYFGKSERAVDGLRQRYLALLRMTPNEARLHLGDQLEALHQKFPGKTLAWYLRWLIADLERAKRP